MLGVDGSNSEGTPDQTAIDHVNRVITTYPGVQFVYVSDGAEAPSDWRNNVNFTRWTYGKFVSLCDI